MRPPDDSAADHLVGFNYTYLFATVLVVAGAAVFYGFAQTWGISVGAQQTMGPIFGLVIGKLVDNITSVTVAITRIAGVDIPSPAPAVLPPPERTLSDE